MNCEFQYNPTLDRRDIDPAGCLSKNLVYSSGELKKRLSSAIQSAFVTKEKRSRESFLKVSTPKAYSK
jgi:hypothetical protein